MQTVCWICGYTAEERAKQGCQPGKCSTPREVGKDPKRCLMSIGCALNELQARNLPKEWSSRAGIGVMLAALGCTSTRYDDAVAALLADTDFPSVQ